MTARMVEKDMDNAPRVADDLSRQFLARARQIARFLDWLWRRETRADQAVSQQFGDPGRVVHVALATRRVANVRRVGQNQREATMILTAPTIERTGRAG
jgi:hypothetical protein